jgi:hypothetical protein
MKLTFSKFEGPVRSGFLFLLVGLCLGPVAGMATDLNYINTGTINGVPPQVDAINFFNSGTWFISTVAPYETANTLTYTNKGLMFGTPGWEFDLGPSTTGSRPNLSSIFYNDNGATIQAGDGTVINMQEITSGGSFLLIQATNIINRGQLIATPFGQIKLVGSTVALNRSTLNIPPIQGAGSANNFGQTNFTSDTAIYDEYWGESATNVFTPDIWDGTNAAAAAGPNVAVVDPCNVTNAATYLGSNPGPFSGFTPSFYAWTNVPDPNSITNISTNGVALVTNRIFRQAVFVTVSDPNIVTNNPSTNALIRFTPTGSASNLFQTVSVWLHSTNATDLYVQDTLGSLTNRGTLKNNSGQVPGANPRTPCTGPAFRPANYLVERLDSSFTNGFTGNVTPPPNNFLFDPSFSNIVVTADVAAYQAFVDDLGYNPSWASVTNLPGRIIINANNLDITRTVISNSGPEVVIQANNIIGSSGAVISCQNVSFNLNSSNGNVNVLNLATNGSLPALNGTVSLWSADWTNFQTVFVPAAATNNTTEIHFHVLLVDATGLLTTVPIKVQDLILETNTVISDSMNVANSFLFKGSSLTLQGNLALFNQIQNWNSSLAPSLLYFTNNGSLSVPNDAHFGDDTAVSYAAFVNNGSIGVGGGETINSAYYQENGGVEDAPQGFFVSAATGLLQNAFIISGQDIDFAVGALQLVNNSVFFAGNTLDFSVTNSLSDSGGANVLNCANGFNLFVAPTSGNLAASTIVDTASGNQLIDHAWAGQDSGSGAPGTVNNVAIGTLSLDAQNPSQLPTFHFFGTSGNNAMYVNTLNLTGLGATAANITSFIQIDPGMKIYFANVQPALLSGQSTLTVLQNQFPGQFIQDANAGLSVGGTSTNIVISGIAAHPAGTFVLTWNSTAGATYSVLKSGVLSASTSWPAIVTNYPAGGAIGGPLSYTDTTATAGPAFYRVMAGSQVAQ